MEGALAVILLVSWENTESYILGGEMPVFLANVNDTLGLTVGVLNMLSSRLLLPANLVASELIG